MGIKTNEFQKETFMVYQHNDPSGYLTAEGSDDWNLVSENFVPEKKLNYIYIASFDYDIDSTGSSLLKMDSLIKSTSSYPDTSRVKFQSIYYYIDSVYIDSVGTIATCDCNALDYEILFRPVHVLKQDKCCEVVYLKVNGQVDYCKLSEIRYKEQFGDWNYVSLIDDLGIAKIENNVYYPIDTICAERWEKGELKNYEFQFRTYNNNNFSCTENHNNTVDCNECPCDWIFLEGRDPIDNNKLAIRLESTYLGKDNNNNCCYALRFINNSPSPILTDKFVINLTGTTNILQNTNSNVIFENKSGFYGWYFNDRQLLPGDTLELGTICISDSIPVQVFWNLVDMINNKESRCTGPKRPVPNILTCAECCPDAYLNYEVKKTLSQCCVIIKSFDDNGCSASVKFYKVVGNIETEIYLPFSFCNTNSAYHLKIKQFDENDSLICVKEYYFNDQLENCDCCEFTDIELYQDNEYEGTGCKYLINSIYETCGFDSTYIVEFGKLSSTTYDSLGAFNYGNELDWEYLLSDCDIDTLVFKFIKDGNVICEKTKIVECQTCEGASVSIMPSLDTNLCCFTIITKSNLGCPYYFKYVYEKEDIPTNIDINGSGFFPITAMSDTIIICGKGERQYNDSVIYDNHILPHTFFHFGIYDKKGNLLCQNEASRVCSNIFDPPVDQTNNQFFDKSNISKKSANSVEQLLITNNKIMLETFRSKSLSIIIYDLNGVKLIERNLDNIISIEYEFNLGNLTSGVYSLIVTHETGHYEKLIKIVK